MIKLRVLSNFVVLWLKASRAPFFMATIVPVFLGASMYYNETGNINLWLFILTLIGALFAHAGTDLANDFFDYLSGTDNINTNVTIFNAGSRVIQEELLKPNSIIYGSLLCFGIASSIGLYLNYISGGRVILILGIIGILSGFFYTAPPFRICHRGWGEFLVGLNFGPTVVLGTYYVQAHSWDVKVILASIPIGLLIANVLYINQFPDFEADKSVGKRNLVVRLGMKRAIKGFCILFLASYFTIGLNIYLQAFPPISIISFLTLPLALRCISVGLKNFRNFQKLLPAMSGTITIHLVVGLLLSGAYVADRFI